MKSESPWAVGLLETFLYYCCPQCDVKDQSQVSFLEHALINHPESQEFLMPLNEVKLEAIDREFGKESPLKLEFEANGDFQNEEENKENLFHYEAANVEMSHDDYEPSEDIFSNDSEDDDASFEPPAKKPKKTTITTPKAKKAAEKCHLCNICHETFRTRDDLRDHRRNVHNIKPKKPIRAANIGPFICKVCSEQFDTRSELRLHDNFVHVKADENGEEKFYCSPCDVYFEERIQFRDHGKSMHDGSGPKLIFDPVLCVQARCSQIKVPQI